MIWMVFIIATISLPSYTLDTRDVVVMKKIIKDLQ